MFSQQNCNCFSTNGIKCFIEYNSNYLQWIGKWFFNSKRLWWNFTLCVCLVECFNSITNSKSFFRNIYINYYRCSILFSNCIFNLNRTGCHFGEYKFYQCKLRFIQRNSNSNSSLSRCLFLPMEQWTNNTNCYRISRWKLYCNRNVFKFLHNNGFGNGWKFRFSNWNGN